VHEDVHELKIFPKLNTKQKINKTTTSKALKIPRYYSTIVLCCLI